MKIIVSSDHAGFYLKSKIISWLKKENFDVFDAGAREYDKKDSYVEFAKKANELMIKNLAQNLGIYICGSGVGMSIVANKQKGIRASVCSSKKLCTSARNDDNINVLCLGAKFTSFFKAKGIIKVFFNTKFEGGRHLERVNNIE